MTEVDVFLLVNLPALTVCDRLKGPDPRQQLKALAEFFTAAAAGACDASNLEIKVDSEFLESRLEKQAAAEAAEQAKAVEARVKAREEKEAAEAPAPSARQKLVHKKAVKKVAR